MRESLRLAWLAIVTLCATLVGHAADYLWEGRNLADGQHASFIPMLDLSVTLALLGCGALALWAIFAYDRRAIALALPPLPLLWLRLSLAQVAGFAALETLEGNSPGLAGCGFEVLIALVATIALSLFCELVESCARVAAAVYLCRHIAPLSPVWCAARSVVTPAFALAAEAGVNRYERPPPLLE